MRVHVGRGSVWLGLGVLACTSAVDSAAPPAPSRIQSARGEMVRLTNQPYADVSTITEPVDVLWPRLKVAYELLNIPVDIDDANRHRLGNSNYRPRRIGGDRLSRYLNCGQGATARQNADTHAVTLSVITTLTAGDTPDETRVETLVQATAKDRATSTRPVQCASKGQLETVIAEMIGRG
jgi:hypothetical protein